jgi:hypothetical protein
VEGIYNRKEEGSFKEERKQEDEWEVVEELKVRGLGWEGGDALHGP